MIKKIQQQVSKNKNGNKKCFEFVYFDWFMVKSTVPKSKNKKTCCVVVLLLVLHIFGWTFGAFAQKLIHYLSGGKTHKNSKNILYK